jgi:hypothetical protein
MLFSEQSWATPLATTAGNEPERVYTPHSDFRILAMGFPVLILEVDGSSNEEDKNRTLLQAACLVHLGNALITHVSPTFLVKAIFIDRNYIAVEHTVYQEGAQVFVLLIAE